MKIIFKRYVKRFFKILACFILFLVINKYIEVKIKQADNIEVKIKQADKIEIKETKKTSNKYAKIIKLNEIPKPHYKFKCVKSSINRGVILCLHDLKNDMYISNDILKNGVWEPKIVGILFYIMSYVFLFIFCKI